ncbi:MAG: tRNA (N(6)-L-threonylcarbamoyladenosine(37)-C(2))-methylthiotransferase MtaB [Anaerolineales bacterium]|nr:tRNA (N(6)-L-threonylcarbamoyladenosine(37)-C(2))-methylthiotransferase MtaB [Anaerolineales bacterium]
MTITQSSIPLCCATIIAMKVYLHSIGCRLNHSEIETMARKLLAAGHEIVAEAADADKVIVNTCAVTAEAARDARTFTRRTHRQNETAEIVLTGCYATIAPNELANIEGAGRIVTNPNKAQLVQMIDPQARIELPVFDQEPIMREYLAGGMGAHTRAFIKVQDGCNNKCTFCITTIARGESQSRHLGDIVAEIQSFAAAGYQEAVLTGVHLGSYGHDFGNKAGLKELVQAILDHTDMPRLRLSSLEPWDIAPDFFALWENPRLLPHLHMPLQSGSDHILRRMARRTSRIGFRQLAAAARAHIPHLNLSSDIIVGFPGETDAHFQESLGFVEEIGFARLHVFSYSPRPGTAASQMSDHVHGAVKKERTRRMIELGKSLSSQFHRQYIGDAMPVLWETAVGANGDGLRWVGYTDNYMRVQTQGPADLFNRVTTTRLTAASPDGLIGELV